MLGETRSGKAQQQSARFYPSLDGLFLGWRIRAGIGIDQHRDVALQQIERAAAAHLGERSKRAVEVIILAQQRLSGEVRRRRDPDRPAPPALVDEQDRAR